MYRGELMEEAPAADLYRTAAHPYTRLLFSSILNRKNAIPSAGNTAEAAPALKGEVRTVLQEIRGCSFADRCPQAMERCFREKPELQESEPGRKLRCFNYGNF
jgi:oligopeptide/dipeptide ABC transporter ATP-binding protein